jgi:hypothetical protein
MQVTLDSFIFLIEKQSKRGGLSHENKITDVGGSFRDLADGAVRFHPAEC